MSDWTEYGRELAAKRLERRKFLKGMLGISGLALAQGTGLARALLPKSSAAALPDPGGNHFTTIVVGMMENRSYDHYFGWRGPDFGGMQEGFSNPTSLEAPPDGCSPVATLAVDDPTPVDTFHLETHCQIPDPDHGWNGGRVQLNHGQVNGFYERSGKVAMGYLEAEDIPFSAWLAENYTTFSNYFCSVLGPTFPNRLYLHSAQGGGHQGNYIPVPDFTNPADLLPLGHRWPTIWDRLNDAGVDWAFYGSDVPTIALFFHEIYENPGKVRHITDFYIDAALGLLPKVAFIDPAFFTYGNDDHPARDIKAGQRFIQDAFLAVAEGPQWYDTSTGKGAAWVMTYDEWGGFYDHVAPPTAPDPMASTNHCDDWGQLGFRVPTILASPFSKPNFVGANVYDHTSILKMIEWNFGLDPVVGTVSNPVTRDGFANNLAEVLDFGQAPRVELPSEPPFIPVHLASLWCAQSPTIEATDGENPLEVIPDIPLPPPVLPGSASASLAKSPDQFEEPHAEMLALADAGYFGKFDMRERAKSGVWRE
ncbi:MAG: alkaline phosphatase family protein [Actinomycetota bacterium]